MKKTNTFLEEKPPHRKILIVDDDLDFAASLDSILKHHGCDTTVAHSEEEALVSMREFDPSLTLIDIRLGPTNGIDLISQFQTIRPDIVCIMITGYGSIDTAVKAIKEGAYDYLRKPVNPEELFACVDRSFEKIFLERDNASIKNILNESKQQIHASFNQAAIGIAHISLKGEGLLFNKKFYQIVGYSKDEHPIKIQSVIHSDDLLKFQEILFRLSGKVVNSLSEEIRFIRKDNITIWTNVTLSAVLSPDGKPLYFILFAEDITDRKEMEKELQTLVKYLAESNQNLEDFTLAASHDLKEPLRKIISFSDRLKVSFGEKLQGKEKDYFERLGNASKRMQELIYDLLQFNRVAHLSPTISKIDLTDVVKEVLLDLEVRIERSKGIVEVKTLPAIEADEAQMKLLFQNLITNALKFKKDSNPPIVTINSVYDQKGYWKISIQDNGIGIESKYFDRIFKPFERLHGRSEFPGTGMGLTIALKIALRHNGEIKLKSELGKGTCAIIHLPEKQ